MNARVGWCNKATATAKSAKLLQLDTQCTCGLVLPDHLLGAGTAVEYVERLAAVAAGGVTGWAVTCECTLVGVSG